ncbi:hypothetical protein D9M69_633910 [compost metagenome]
MHIAAPHRLLVQRGIARHSPHHLAALAAPPQRTRQVHQTSTFGVGGQAGRYGFGNLRAQRRIGLQLAHEQLGETTADEQAVDGIGQRRVAQGVERQQHGPRVAQSLQVVRVIKTESPVLGQGDAHGPC